MYISDVEILKTFFVPSPSPLKTEPFWKTLENLSLSASSQSCPCKCLPLNLSGKTFFAVKRLTLVTGFIKFSALLGPRSSRLDFIYKLFNIFLILFLPFCPCLRTFSAPDRERLLRSFFFHSRTPREEHFFFLPFTNKKIHRRVFGDLKSIVEVLFFFLLSDESFLSLLNFSLYFLLFTFDVFYLLKFSGWESSLFELQPGFRWTMTNPPP